MFMACLLFYNIKAKFKSSNCETATCNYAAILYITISKKIYTFICQIRL